jgi:diguanylate cyclase (GGDEF)-like protein
VVEVVAAAPPSTGARTPAWPDVRPFVLAGVVILALSAAAARLRLDDSDVSLWWPAAGASVAAIVSVRDRHRSAMVLLVALVSAAGNLLGGRPPALSLWLGAADAAEAAVTSWWILRGSSGRPALMTLGDLWRLVVGGLLGSVVVAVGIRAVVVPLTGSVGWAALPHVAASHLSAVLLVVPLVLRTSGTGAEAGRVETALQWVATVVVTAHAFSPWTGLPLSFVPLAPLLWGALRLPVRVVVRQLVLVLLGVSVLTVLGGGSFTAAADVSADPMLAATLLEVYLLVTVLSSLSLALAADQRRATLQQLARSERRFRAMALHDPLTDLPNRTLLRSRIEQALEQGQRDGGGPALLFLDLDDFKRVNDSMGHEAGDDLLVRVADRLRGAVRASDVVARLGGDEFCVLLPSIEPDSVQRAVDRVLASLAAPISIQAGTYRLSASIGVVKHCAGSTVSGLLRDADTAMYVSKAGGGGRATYFDDTFRARMLRSVEIGQEFEGAIDRGELRLFAQPVVELSTGRVVSAETLVRWQHPDRGLLLPGEWLDIAQGGPSGEHLDRWVLWESCRLAASWAASTGSAALRVHVNVSGRQVLRGDLRDQVLAALDETGLPAACLVVELTEDQLEGVGDSVFRDLEELRRRGIGLAVDDFGTGFSAFTRLIDYPVDMVKIDRAFVARMLHDVRSRAVVDVTVQLARDLSLDVVAEGVETEEQAAFLRRAGCGLAQGHLWSRALSPEDFAGLLRPATAPEAVDGPARPVPTR